MRQARVRVVGYLSIDTLQVDDTMSERVPGGAALYAALGARHAGAAVSMEACVGDDYPAHWLRAVGALGIDVSRVQRRTGRTRTATLRYHDGGSRTSSHFRDALWWERTRELAPVAADDLSRADVVVACPMPIETLSTLMARAADAGVPVVADTSEAFVSESPELLMELVGRLAIFAPSREETRQLLPRHDDDAAAAWLAGLGAHILQKRGAQGARAIVGRAGQSASIPAPPAAVVDPTGAGDATVGALAAHWSTNGDFLAAARAALTVGALATTGTGPAGLGLAVDSPAHSP
jgi:sugar/nucleoside kinase (ribokinase family)